MAVQKGESEMNNKQKAKRLRKIKSNFEAVEPYLDGDHLNGRHKVWDDDTRNVLQIAIESAVEHRALIREMANKYDFEDIITDVLRALSRHAIAKKNNENVTTLIEWENYFSRGCAIDPNFAQLLGILADQIEDEPDETSDHEFQVPREPIPDQARLIYDKLVELPPEKGMKGDELLGWLGKEHDIFISEPTLRKTYLKPLNKWGLENKRGAGYHIPLCKRSRPKREIFT